MEDYKSLVSESSYRQQLLKEIAKINDFSAVPETLYYEAVSTRMYLERNGTDEETQGVLSAFIKMVDVEHLTDSEMKSLMDKKVRPKSIREEFYRTGDLGFYIKKRLPNLFIMACMMLLQQIPTDFFYKLFVREFAIMVSVVLNITTLLIFMYEAVMIVLDIAYYYVPAVRLELDNSDGSTEKYITSEMREAVIKGVHSEHEITSLWSRTYNFLNRLPRGVAEPLRKRFDATKVRTHEYYEVCAEIELAYADHIKSKPSEDESEKEDYDDKMVRYLNELPDEIGEPLRDRFTEAKVGSMAYYKVCKEIESAYEEYKKEVQGSD